VRMPRWLRKHGVTRDGHDSDSNGTPVFTFVPTLVQVAAGRETFEKVENCHDSTQASSTQTNPRPPPCDGAVTYCGLCLHAASDRSCPATRSHGCVYCAIVGARTFDQDVLLCGQCGRHLRVRAVIVNAELTMENAEMQKL